MIIDCVGCRKQWELPEELNQPLQGARLACPGCGHLLTAGQPPLWEPGVESPTHLDLQAARLDAIGRPVPPSRPLSGLRFALDQAVAQLNALRSWELVPAEPQATPEPARLPAQPVMPPTDIIRPVLTKAGPAQQPGGAPATASLRGPTAPLEFAISPPVGEEPARPVEPPAEPEEVELPEAEEVLLPAGEEGLAASDQVLEPTAEVITPEELLVEDLPEVLPEAELVEEDIPLAQAKPTGRVVVLPEVIGAADHADPLEAPASVPPPTAAPPVDEEAQRPPKVRTISSSSIRIQEHAPEPALEITQLEDPSPPQRSPTPDRGVKSRVPAEPATLDPAVAPPAPRPVELPVVSPPTPGATPPTAPTQSGKYSVLLLLLLLVAIAALLFFWFGDSWF